MRSSGSVIVLALSSCIGACSGVRTMVDDPAAQTWAASDDQLDFFENLSQQAIVTNDDALHAMLLFETGDSPAQFAERVAEAVGLGWLEDTPGEANASARVGMIASIAARTPEIQSGIAMGLALKHPWRAGELLGASATKRLRALGMVPPRSADQAMTGGELIALLRRIEVYQKTHTGGGVPLP